jgi:pimeloyl-ACP methyl ester carboxylesterase
MKAWRIILIVAGALAILAGLAAVATRPGVVPPVTDGMGRPVWGSLAVWEPISIGGVRQWLAIRGRDPDNPVLLFVHGGPGDPETALLFHYNPELSDCFTVVCWEQRGAGRSFSPEVPPESMTLERFVEDAHEVTRYLQRRFKTERIFLAGHSWGSVVGILAVAGYPEDYNAYIGISQAADQAQSEREGYGWALETAKARNNRKAVDELLKIGPPVEGSYAGGLKALKRQRRWIQAFGGATYGRSIWPLARVLLSSQVYSLTDKIRWFRGGRFSMRHLMKPENIQVNLFDRVPELRVPVFLLQGRHDYQTTFSVAERYLDTLKAPLKRLVPFEHSAHAVPFDEPEKFRQVMVDLVLREVLVSAPTGD